MVDTQRTIAALQTLLADNSVGAISPQDLRDFLVSVEPDRGQIYWTTPTATTISNTTNYFKAAGTTTLSSGAKNFSMSANGRLRYDGTPTRAFLIMCTFTVTTAANSVIMHYRLGVDGTTAVATEIKRTRTTSTNQIPLTVVHTATLATSQYVELFIRNESSATNATIQLGNLVVWGGMD